MYLQRTEQQAEIAAACRRLLMAHWPSNSVAQALEREPLPTPLWDSCLEMGWLDILRPESSGGLGLTLVEAGAVSEEAGRALVPGPLVEAMALAVIPGADLRPEIDPSSVTIADPSRCEVRLSSDATLSGVLRFVPYADRSRQVLVVVGSGIYAVALDDADIQIREGVDLVSRACDVTLARAAATQLSDDAGAVAQLHLTMQSLLAARQLGMLDAALEMAVAYVQQREQFGQVVGSFQAVQQMLSQAAVHAIAARSACYASQAAIADQSADATPRTRAAKSYVTTATRSVIETAIQAHGGIGFTAEVALHLYLKHALSLATRWSGRDDLHLQLARGLVQRVGSSASGSGG